MKRFNFEEDEEEEDDDEEYYEDSEEMNMDMDFEDHLLAMTHFPIGDDLLPSAIKVCEKSLFWRFRSFSYKVKKIRMVYLALKDFIEEEKKTGEV